MPGRTAFALRRREARGATRLQRNPTGENGSGNLDRDVPPRCDEAVADGLQPALLGRALGSVGDRRAKGGKKTVGRELRGWPGASCPEGIACEANGHKVMARQASPVGDIQVVGGEVVERLLHVALGQPGAVSYTHLRAH